MRIVKALFQKVGRGREGGREGERESEREREKRETKTEHCPVLNKIVRCKKVLKR